MTSLSLIMDDVDIDPHDSQQYTRSKEAAQTESTPSSQHSQSQSENQLPIVLRPSPDETSFRKRRAHRAPKSPSRGSSRPGNSQHRRIAAGHTIDFTSGAEGSGSGSGQPSIPEMPRKMSRTEPGAEGDVKYTKVTGRISKAKKGVPVHMCDLCRPTKVWCLRRPDMRSYSCHNPTDSTSANRQGRLLRGQST